MASAHSYKVGDSIRVVDGPFRNLVGSVELVAAEKRKLRAVIIMKRGTTPVELDFLQVAPL